MEKTIEAQNVDLILRWNDMTKEDWIRAVMEAYPHKTLEETQILWTQIFDYYRRNKKK